MKTKNSTGNWRKSLLLSSVFSFFLFLVLISYAVADEGVAPPDQAQKTAYKRTVLAAQPAPVAQAPVAQAPAVQKTGGESTSLWDKMRDGMPAIVNPFSEISIRDAGTKPRIRPHLYTDSSWNSNTTGGRQDAGGWQARVSPGISLEVPVSDKLYTQLDYTYSFSTTQGSKYSNNDNSHNLEAMARYDLSNDTSLGVRNNFQISEMPDRTGKNFLLESVNPEIQHKFGEKLRSALGYQFQHFRDITPNDQTLIGVNGNNTAITRDSFNDNQIKTSLTYDVSKKLSLSPNFTWDTREFAKTNQKDYWQVRPDLGATYGLGSKTKLSGHFGWGYRRFRNGGYDSELVYGAGLNHQLGKKMVWGVNYDKSQQDTFDTNFINRENAVATNLDNYDRHFRVITVHRIGTSATYFFNEKNSLGAFADFSFTDTNRADNIVSNDTNNEKAMSIGTMYRYMITRYLDLRLGYTFGRNFTAHGNPAREEYSTHKITAGVNIAI